MNISSSMRHLTTHRSACKPGDCPVEERKKCRQEIRDMVIESDNALVTSTLFTAGAVVAGFLTAGQAIGTLTGSLGTGLGIVGTVIGGAATAGCYTMKVKKDQEAISKFQEAFERADETGCYTREELYDWYRRSVAG